MSATARLVGAFILVAHSLLSQKLQLSRLHLLNKSRYRRSPRTKSITQWTQSQTGMFRNRMASGLVTHSLSRQGTEPLTVVPSPFHEPDKVDRKGKRKAEEIAGAPVAKGAMGKRARIAVNVPPAPEIMTKISLVHEAIQSISDDFDFSNPHNRTILPFPSPLEIPWGRFQVACTKPMRTFQYMGRSAFHTILNEAADLHSLNGSQTLYLYGTSGTGKSHLLAALVCYLVLGRNRVIYIPDCSQLLDNPLETLRAALLFAFHDDSGLCKAIESANDVDGLIRSVKRPRHEPLYLIVDQRNALDYKSDAGDHIKTTVRGYIDAMKSGWRYIFSASANEQADRDADKKQTRIKTIYLRKE
jgi:hypothetical protein